MEERRQGSERRRHPRGGRRPEDRFGFSPLVMIVDADHQRRELTEAILAKLQFAVAPVESVEKAISIAHSLRPSVIVCGTADASRVRDGLRVGIPLVVVSAEAAVTEALVEVVRTTLRSAPV